MRAENSHLIEEGVESPVKEEPKKEYMLSGCIGFIQTKSYHLMSVIPKVQIVILVLMIIDFVSLIMLCLTDASDGMDSWVLIFFIVSAITTILGVIYLCATKPPKDIAKLMDGHKQLLSQLSLLNHRHQENVKEQVGLIEKHKDENRKLRNEVDNFEGENTKLQENLEDMKNSNEFLAKHSKEHVSCMANQISSFKKENELYEKLNEELFDSNEKIKSVRIAMMEDVQNQKKMTEGFLNVKNTRERGLTNRGVNNKDLQDAIRQVELREEVKELPDPPTHTHSEAFPEPPTHKPAVD